MRTVTSRLIGLLLILLGAWGGIVAFAGPAIGFRMGNGPAWTWTTANWELHAAPGAAVVAAPRMIARFGAFLAVLGGMWLVVGPLFASIWLGSSAETKLASSTLAQAARPLGYHYGTGLLIVAFAAYAWALCSAYVHAVPYPGAGAHRRDAAVEESRLSTMLGTDD
jgi:hypothetical protein